MINITDFDAKALIIQIDGVPTQDPRLQPVFSIRWRLACNGAVEYDLCRNMKSPPITRIIVKRLRNPPKATITFADPLFLAGRGGVANGNVADGSKLVSGSFEDRAIPSRPSEASLSQPQQMQSIAS